MELFTPPFVLPVMAAISSRESPVALNWSNRLVPAGSRSNALSAIFSASDCSISVEASLPSDNHSGYTPLLTGPFLRQSEMQLFLVVETAQASALRICTPSRLATQSRSSTSCTTSSGSPSSRDARKNFNAVASTLGLISVSSISSILSILHRHRRKNRKKSSKFSNFFHPCLCQQESGQSHFAPLPLRSVPSEESRSSTPRYGFVVFHLGAKYQRTPPERAAPVFQYLDSPTRIVIVFAISCQYDNSRPRLHAVANHQINMPSYRVVSTLPVPAVLRAAQPAQDGGYERPQNQAEDDDKDQGQSIFHNLEL